MTFATLLTKEKRTHQKSTQNAGRFGHKMQRKSCKHRLVAALSELLVRAVGKGSLAMTTTTVAQVNVRESVCEVSILFKKCSLLRGTLLARREEDQTATGLSWATVTATELVRSNYSPVRHDETELPYCLTRCLRRYERVLR